MNADIAPDSDEATKTEIKETEPINDLASIILNPATLSPVGGGRLSVAAQALSSHQRRRTANLLKELQEKRRE
jgi:hypothetical protein